MNYPRKITALFPRSFKSIFNGVFFHYLAQFLFLVLLFQVLLLILTGFVLRYAFEKKKVVIAQRQNVQEYWIKVAGQYPQSPDVLYNVAVSSKNIGDKKTAILYIEKALRLDPLFEEAKALSNELKD